MQYAVFFSPDDTFLLFNGHEGLVIPYADLKVGDEIAEAVLRYYAAPAAEKSERLADFSYRELCLALDKLYGQKESHDITDFNSFFEEAGLADELKSTECTVNVKSTLTGASSSVLYTADVNLDKKTDEKDTVSDRNLFCLISPVSFSAANTVASALKASGRVTMLGGRTCGGSSAVTSMSTAYGSLFQLSTTFRMSTVKNGSFYDIDQGVEPDYLIMDPDHFYDRDALAEYINQLY